MASGTDFVKGLDRSKWVRSLLFMG
jgi:hypothetical protein